MNGDHGDLTGGEDAPKDLVVGFWTLVLFFKVAVMAIGLGAVFLVFTDYTIVGLGLLGVSVYVLLRWVLTYRRLKRRHELS